MNCAWIQQEWYWALATQIATQTSKCVLGPLLWKRAIILAFTLNSFKRKRNLIYLRCLMVTIHSLQCICAIHVLGCRPLMLTLASYSWFPLPLLRYVVIVNCSPSLTLYIWIVLWTAMYSSIELCHFTFDTSLILVCLFSSFCLLPPFACYQGPNSHSPLLISLSGDYSSSLNITSSGHEVFLRWSADHGTNKKGFRIRYIGM